MATSRLLEETRQAPQAVARALSADRERFAQFGALLRAQAPRAVLTLARGSSDHAAHYAAYLVMARLGQLVTSLPMSVITLHGAALQTEGLLAVAFSQSGASTDLVETTRNFAARGALTAAFVNADDSALAEAAAWPFALHAGAETSVAASKSFIAQLLAGARWVAAWQDDAAWATAIDAMPGALQRALEAGNTWAERAVPLLAGHERMLVVGRGTGLAIAMEAALKLKEVCGIQAEAFSGAELQHGPLALVEPGYPVLIFAPRGPAHAGLMALADDLRARGALVLLAAEAAGTALPWVSAAAPELDPLCAIQSFYVLAEALARARGRDPDAPPHLSKVTRTR
jgi:glucosamine--fructose-6-phosphate aminotransferase (isomerizing)